MLNLLFADAEEETLAGVVTGKGGGGLEVYRNLMPLEEPK